MLSADVPRDELVVAGQDLHRDAVALELREDVGDVRQDGSAKLMKPGEHQIGLVVARVGVARLQPAVGDGQDAQPSALSRSWTAAHVCLRRRVERRDLTFRFECGRQRQDRLRRALGDEQPPAAAVRRSTTTDSRRRSKSNGISSIFR